MSVEITTYDVFLSYSLAEAEIAQLVEACLSKAGLDVFNPASLEAAADVSEVLWRALAESAALVVIVDPRRAPGSNVGVELGAAMAWHKPIYVLHTDGAAIKLPSYLHGFPAYPVSRVDDVARSIKRGLTTLSENERSALVSTYLELGIPIDRLLATPANVDALGREFKNRCDRPISGERLVQELLRLRKAGHLPRLRR